MESGRQLVEHVPEQGIGFRTQMAPPLCHCKRSALSVDQRRFQAQRKVDAKPGRYRGTLEGARLMTTRFAHNSFDQGSIHRAPRVALANRDTEANRTRIARNQRGSYGQELAGRSDRCSVRRAQYRRILRG